MKKRSEIVKLTQISFFFFQIAQQLLNAFLMDVYRSEEENQGHKKNYKIEENLEQVRNILEQKKVEESEG